LENHDNIRFAHFLELERQDLTVKLDSLHKHKIDLAEEVMIINVGGHMGESTRQELEYAKSRKLFDV
jgi:hypothetical protein